MTTGWICPQCKNVYSPAVMSCSQCCSKAAEVPANAQPIPEGLNIEDIIKKLSPFEEYTDEEILYYSTPYFDELLARKEALQQKSAEKGEGE